VSCTIRTLAVSKVGVGLPCPGDQECPFAMAAGGGIDNWGTLQISDFTISDNRIGSASGLSTLACDVEAGGVHSLIGSLTILRNRIEDSRATASAPNGLVSRAASRWSASPGDPPRRQRPHRRHHALGDPDNSAGMTNTVGDAVSFSGGLHVGIPVDFNITDSLIAGNRVNAPRLGSSPGFTHGDGGAGQLFGHMRRTRVHGNTSPPPPTPATQRRWRADCGCSPAR
jgi:hypothetical protein